MTEALTDLLISLLEKGIVVVIRLSGEPGDRQLMVGLGLPQSVDPMLLALGVMQRPAHDWFE